MLKTNVPDKKGGVAALLASTVGRVLVSFFVPIATFVVLWQGFLFLRDSNAPKLVITLVAIIWGVGGVALLYWVSNWLIEQLPTDWSARLLPYVFVGPAIAILTWFLALPVIRTFWISLFGRTGAPRQLFPAETGLAENLTNLGTHLTVYFADFQWFGNYAAVFTDRSMLESFRNNMLWLIFGTGFSVLFGLLIAVLADRSKFEKVAKSLIFLPMAISFVGAGIIWRFIYALKPANEAQIGLLNALVVGLGGDPKPWVAWTEYGFVNNFFLIVIVIWLQAGFAMVLFSAALKGVPNDLLEAARVDGANEFQIFFRIILPSIQATIITVSTTIAIFTLKIFDVVLVMTGGQFGTEVIATNFYRQAFSNRNAGYGSALAIVLLIAVIPVMIYNLRSFNEREAF